jgi:type II secretion system protein G
LRETINIKDMFKTKHKQAAFTLLELLVVIAILALLTGLGLRTFGTVQQKSRDSRRKQDLQNISKALEIYFNDFKRYPATDDLGGIVACGVNAAQTCQWGQTWDNTSDNTLYMSVLPKDPGGSNYYYWADSQGHSYRLFAYLENLEDDSVVKNAEAEATFYSDAACRIVNDSLVDNSCNYVLTSSNLSSTPILADGE